MERELWNQDQSTTSFSSTQAQYEGEVIISDESEWFKFYISGPSILLSDNDDFTDISHLLNTDAEGSAPASWSNYTVNICNTKASSNIDIQYKVILCWNIQM